MTREPVRDVAPKAPIDRGWVDWAVARLRADTLPQRRHPPAAAAHPGGARRRRLPQGRVDPPDRQPQAPPGAVAVPLRHLQRRHRSRQHGRRGVQRLDGDQRGVLRPAARAAVRGGGRPLDQPRQARPDRARGRPVRAGGLRRRRLRGRPPPRRRAGRPLPRPVHQRRARHRLARQQQHRRVDLRAAGRRAAPGARVDRGGRGHRRHERDDRPLPALPRPGHPARRRRSGGFGVPAGLRGRDRGHPGFAHRGHRTAPGRAVVHAPGRRPHDRRARCGVGRDDALPRRPVRAARGPVHRHQPLRRPAAGVRTARARAAPAAS